MSNETAIERRRRLAHEAWADKHDASLTDRLTQSIKAATRVRITAEMVEAAMASTEGPIFLDETKAALKAAFEAAGFEVEQ